MIKEYFFCNVDDEVNKLMDENSVTNIENISIAIALFEMISLFVFVLSQDHFDQGEWISVGSVLFCFATCLSGYFFARYVKRKETFTHQQLMVFNALYYLLMSVWAIWTSYRQYSRGEQILTFYAVEVMRVCFIGLKPWLSTILTIVVYSTLYGVLFAIDGADGINLMNYIALGLISIVGVTVRYQSMLRMSEATVRMKKAKDSEIRDKVDVLQSIADIYDNVNLIDFSDRTEMSVRDKEHKKHALDDGATFHTIMSKRIRERVMPDQLKDFIAFTDIATVRKRLKGKKLISGDFVDMEDGWIRAQYIPVDTDEDGLPVRIIFTTRNVDDEKKREEQLIRIAMTDELTRLFNRRSYEEDLTEYESRALEKDFVLMSADVNGLKTINDTLGHMAGDELIRSAAKCLMLAIGSKGKVYRTGGDEFMAILHTDDVKTLCRDIEASAASWKGFYSKDLSISIGYAASADYPEMNIHELEKKADDEMYLAKAKHYEKTGYDRRNRRKNIAENQ